MSTVRNWRRPLAVVLFLCAQYPAAFAAGEPLTLAQALARAEAADPGLKAASLQASAAAAGRDQAGARLNPELSLELENVLGSGPYTGADSVETTLTISQTFDRSRAGRRAVAEAELALARSEVDRQRLALRAETARRFVAVLAAQDRLALAQRTLQAAADTRVDLDRRAEAARAPIAERNRARMAHERARLGARNAERTLVTARRDLLALWSGGDADFARASGDLFALPDVADDAALRAALARSPVSISRQVQEQLREAEASRARADARQPVTASIGLRDFADTSDNAFLLGVSVPIPLFDRNRGAIAAAEARLEAQRAESAASRRDAELHLLALVDELRQQRETVQSLRETSLPLATEALAQTKLGFERGRFSWLELATAQQDLIDTENDAIEAAATFHVRLAELEALTGLAIARPAIAQEK